MRTYALQRGKFEIRMKLSFLCLFLVAKINGARIVLLLKGLVVGMGVNLSIAMGGRKFLKVKKQFS